MTTPVPDPDPPPMPTSSRSDRGQAPPPSTSLALADSWRSQTPRATSRLRAVREYRGRFADL